MWVLCAPGGFKGTLLPHEAAAAMAAAFTASGLPIALDIGPLADGGAGTLTCLATPLALQIQTVRATALDGRQVDARIGWRGGRAVIESADVVGLSLVPAAHRRPRTATSRGLGELVAHAAAAGADEIWIALGDTGVVDGGRGMRAAYTPPPRAPKLIGLVDVDAPLVGPAGARRFMEQKGVPAADLDAVEAELRALHPAFVDTPGAGAAGGLGAAVLSLGGSLESGATRVADAIDLDARVARASLVLTGEGALDVQSLQGKVIGHLAALCARHRTPLVALCGQVALSVDAQRRAGIDAAVALGPDAASRLGAAAVDAARSKLHLP